MTILFFGRRKVGMKSHPPNRRAYPFTPPRLSWYDPPEAWQACHASPLYPFFDKNLLQVIFFPTLNAYRPQCPLVLASCMVSRF